MKKLIVVLIVIVLLAGIVGTCVALYKMNGSRNVQVTVEDPVVTLSINNASNTAAQTNFTLEGFSPSARQKTKDITLDCTNPSAAGDVQGLFTVAKSGALAPYIDITVNLLNSAGGSLGENITQASMGDGKTFALSGSPRYVRITAYLNNDGVNSFEQASEQQATISLGWTIAATAAIYGDETISFHFLELGNNYTGDCTYIKAGDIDILIDAGSRQNSASTIANYVSAAGRCTDGKLEYVIATHAHQDHIAGFTDTKNNPGIFSRYECGVIIDFARTNATSQVYNNYVSSRDAEVQAGATHVTALQCYNNTEGGFRTYSLGKSMSMTILYQRFYENNTSDENDYSVCVLFTHGDKHYLFTGDLEAEGEASLVESNDLPEVELFKAGHHGSYTATTDTLLSEIKPKIVCVCCCAGSVEYTSNLANTFPSQAFVNRVAPYTDKVYVTTVGTIQQKVKDGVPQVDKKGNPVYEDTGFTSMNGNITVTSAAGTVTVTCSNNTTKLKDTAWFLANRTMPVAWEGGGGGDPTPTVVSIPAADTTAFAYTGAAQTYNIPANSAYTVSNNVQTAVGTYTVTVALKDKTNTSWSDSTTADKTYTFTIAKGSVAEPAADETAFKYTGSAQTYSVAANANYTVSNNVQTAAGTYPVIVSLNEPANYKWASSGDSDDLQYTFTIASRTTLPTSNTYGSADLKFHFLRVGSNSFADCVYVQAGSVDILIDAGRAAADSLTAIKNYLNSSGMCADGTLEYVVATHARDYAIGGFSGDSGIFASYTCETIIEFPNKKTTGTFYNNYVTARTAEVQAGATCYTALQCVNETDGAQSTYNLGNGMYMSVLYQYYYDRTASGDNDYSVCLLFTHGSKHFLFTGDLELGESSLVAGYDLPKADLFKAGNEGGDASSSAALLAAIDPEIVVVSAYVTDGSALSQNWIDRVATYTDAVYVTGKTTTGGNAMNGNIVVTSSAGNVTVSCSNNDTLLKDTAWLSSNREIPEAWVGQGGNAPTLVSIPAADTTSFVYNGQEQTYSIAANDAYTVTNNAKTAAGAYTVIVALKDKVNTAWSDSTTADKEFSFVIEKASVAEPAADATVFKYNGSAQTYNLAANALYTISNNLTQTDMGHYPVSITLTDGANYKWAASGNSDALTYDFTINGKTALPKDGAVGSGTMTFHILNIANNSYGNCVYVKAGETDILIDAGKSTSLNEIKSYLSGKVTDNKFEYVIATHPHQDNIGGFAADNGIFASFDIDTLIDFPSTNQGAAFYATTYVNARASKVGAGMTHYTALQCVNETDGAQSTYNLGDGMYLSILYQGGYESNSSNYNNDSVCVLFTHGDRHFLFTGDLESTGETSLAANNLLPTVDLFMIGDQGSSSSAGTTLLQKISPSIFCVSGYAKASDKPNQTLINRIAAYSDSVYVTGQYADGTSTVIPMNGNITVTSAPAGISVAGSNSSAKLKDTAWFRANRTMPTGWTAEEALTLVSIPAADNTSFVYNGQEQTYNIPANEAYTVTNNVKTAAGAYTVTVALKDKVNTAWSDSTVGDKTYAFTIDKVSVAEPAADSTVFMYNGTQQTYNLAANNLYTISGNTQTAMAHHVVSVALKDTANYKWATSGDSNALSYDFTINGKTVIPHADTYGSSSMTFHILRLDGGSYGECVYVKAGETDILIDAGKNANAASIKAYVDQYCTDGILEYVIATHGQQVNIEGFTTIGDKAGIFDLYQVGTIIEFAGHGLADASATVVNYYAARDAEVAAGAVCYTADQCVNGQGGAQSTYSLGTGMYMSILYHSVSDHVGDISDIDSFSVSVLFNHGDKYFLFTGDLEAAGEASLIANNLLPEVALFRAGDQGRADGTSAALLSVVKPEIVAISASIPGAANANPVDQSTVDNIATQTDQVYVTGYSTTGSYVMNGTIVVTSSAGNVSVNCELNNNLLKNNAWFQTHRTTPASWQAN